MLVDDSSSSGFGHDGGHILPAVHCLGGAERFALVSVRLGENGANEFACVPDNVNKGHLSPGRVDAGDSPGTIGSLSWRVEGFEILHETSRRVEGAFDGKASDIMLNFCLGVEVGDLGVFAVRIFFWLAAVY